MNLEQLQAEVGGWARKNFGEQPPYRPLLGVAEEVGELAHAQLKLEQGIRVDENHHEAIKDAVGDIIIFLADFCGRSNISLQQCIDTAWDEVKKRDWTKNKTDGSYTAFKVTISSFGYKSFKVINAQNEEQAIDRMCIASVDDPGVSYTAYKHINNESFEPEESIVVERI